MGGKEPASYVDSELHSIDLYLALHVLLICDEIELFRGVRELPFSFGNKVFLQEFMWLS